MSILRPQMYHELGLPFIFDALKHKNIIIINYFGPKTAVQSLFTGEKLGLEQNLIHRPPLIFDFSKHMYVC